MRSCATRTCGVSSASCPAPGIIGHLRPSHYEDVCIVRVNNLVEKSVWSSVTTKSMRGGGLGGRRDGVDQVFSQSFLGRAKDRLLARLDDPTKHWKYNPGDVDERAKWPAYWRPIKRAGACNTKRAPGT
jgi:polyphosphate kinase 2 (PPK2 family)